MALQSHNKPDERGLPGNCLALPRAHRDPETSVTSLNREGESGNCLIQPKSHIMQQGGLVGKNFLC